MIFRLHFEDRPVGDRIDLDQDTLSRHFRCDSHSFRLGGQADAMADPSRAGHAHRLGDVIAQIVGGNDRE